LRDQVRMLQANNHRLTMALSSKAGEPLILESPEPLPRAPEPEPPLPSEAEAIARQSRALDGWWQANTSGHTIATPPKEEKVPAPKN